MTCVDKTHHIIYSPSIQGAEVKKFEGDRKANNLVSFAKDHYKATGTEAQLREVMDTLRDLQVRCDY
jgi:hypothetical protein